jgi:hypothetical protein
LFHLIEMICASGPRSVAIIGIPVGFIGAIESRGALLPHEAGIPSVVACPPGRHGRFILPSMPTAAPQGGDDAVMSLSDRRKPWDVIA